MGTLRIAFLGENLTRQESDDLRSKIKTFLANNPKLKPLGVPEYLESDPL